MGFFSKLFGKTESEPFEMDPTAEMLDEDKYWRIIKDSLDASGGDLECQLNCIVGALEKLSPVEIVGFRLRTDKLLFDTYDSEMWCAGYLINGGCSDDMFDYFRLWVISRGRAVYEAAKKNPDSLAQTIDASMGQEYDFESLSYAPLDAFKNKTGRELYDYIDDGFKLSEGSDTQIEFTWEEDNPESLQRICPDLFRRFPLT